MKLVSFDRHGKSGFGAVIGDGILDLGGSRYQDTQFANLREVFAAGPMALVELQKLVNEGSPNF